MPPRSGLSLLFVVLALAGGGYYFTLEAEKPVEAAADKEKKDPPPPKPTAIVAKLPAPKPQTEVDTELGKLRLPDGSYVPTLNGVKGFAKLRWGSAPFSPIDHIIRDQDGLEWWVLKNGDYLTTVNKEGTVGDRVENRNIIVRHQRKEMIDVTKSMDLVEPKKK